MGEPRFVAVDVDTMKIVSQQMLDQLKKDLGVTSQEGDALTLGAHLADTTPHPVYDDMVDLTLLYENGII